MRDGAALGSIDAKWGERPRLDEVDDSCSTGIECAKVQLSSTARKGATQ